MHRNLIFLIHPILQWKQSANDARSDQRHFCLHANNFFILASEKTTR